MQALLKRAGSMLRPASSCIFQTIRSMRWESKVVVEGLASTIDDRILREAFSPYGNVAEARVVVDRETGRSVGFGFVTYEDYDSCDRAVGGMHQWELHGQTVRVSWATPPGADSSDQDGSENIPISLVGRRSTSVLDRWINRGFKLKLLDSGMVLLKEYLTIMGQADIMNICQKRAVGPGGFYRPRSPSGHELTLRMMCYGRQWDPVARYEKQYRSDGSHPPSIPDEFMSLVEIAIQDALKHRFLVNFPTMRPDICIANYYFAETGRLSIHQSSSDTILDWLHKEMGYIPLGPYISSTKASMPSSDAIHRVCRGNMILVWDFLLKRVKSEKTVESIRCNILVHDEKDNSVGAAVVSGEGGRRSGGRRTKEKVAGDGNINNTLRG